MKQIYTQCFSIEEADSLGHFIMGKGYEGVQNDSYRYCRESMERALKENARHNQNYCYVGVNGGIMVVGSTKRSMRNLLSMKFIEKPRVFMEILERV